MVSCADFQQIRKKRMEPRNANGVEWNDLGKLYPMSFERGLRAAREIAPHVHRHYTCIANIASPMFYTRTRLLRPVYIARASIAQPIPACTRAHVSSRYPRARARM